MKSKELSSAVRLALSLGAAMTFGVSGLAYARNGAATPTASADQSDQANQPPPSKAVQLQGVVVTGSHIRRVDLETANPVISVDRAAIVATGDLNLGQLVQDLPAMTGGITNPQVNNGGGAGKSNVNLRGLGPNRSLILVDGHRVVSTDTNSIPAAMIERIDVLKDGASAVYGSDAIGGVVNFITRKNYQGAQFTTNFGQSSKADGRQKGYTFTFGQTSDKGSILGGIGYSKIDGVLSSQRAFSKNALSLRGNPGDFPKAFVGGSGSSAYGDIQIPSSGPIHDAFASCASGDLARNPGAGGMDPIKDYHCYQTAGANSDKYNYASVNLIMTPQERNDVFVIGTYNLTDNVSVYADAYYTKTRSSYQIAPGVYGTFYGANISAQNYWNPFGMEYSSRGGQFLSRLVALGNRGGNYSTAVGQVSTGLRGMFAVMNQDWNWEVGMDYGHTTQNILNTGLANNSKLYTGPSFMDPTTGQVTCGVPGSPISGCDASFNPFNMSVPASAAALKAAGAPALTNKYQQERVWRAALNGGLLDVPAGTVQLAVGANYRQEHSTSVIGPLLLINPATGSCTLASGCSAGLQGGYNVKEGYAELFVPILHDMPFANSLNMTLGDRYSRFSSFGSTNDKEFKTEWRPIRDLMLRGTVAEVFRAPDINEVFDAPALDAPPLKSDPCDGYTGRPVNPACVNVPTDGSFRNYNVSHGTAANTITSGSKYAGFPIKPESGKSFDWGAVYSPSWAPGLSGSVDVWHLYLNDIITQVGTQSLLDLCSAGQTLYCPFIHRIPSGPQQGNIDVTTLEPTGNLGSVNTGGVDGSLAYKLDTDSIGRFDFQLNATYLKYYNQQTAPGLPGNIVFHDAGHVLTYGSAAGSACTGGSECLYPRWRGTGSVHWLLGNWSAGYRFRYIGAFRMGSQSPSQDVFPAGGDLPGYYIDYGATWYQDISLGYDIKPLNTRIDIGVNNVSNKQPPILYANNTNNANSMAGVFDYLGRYYWARVTVSF